MAETPDEKTTPLTPLERVHATQDNLRKNRERGQNNGNAPDNAHAPEGTSVDHKEDTPAGSNPRFHPQRELG